MTRERIPATEEIKRKDRKAECLLPLPLKKRAGGPTPLKKKRNYAMRRESIISENRPTKTRQIDRDRDKDRRKDVETFVARIRTRPDSQSENATRKRFRDTKVENWNRGERGCETRKIHLAFLQKRRKRKGLTVLVGISKGEQTRGKIQWPDIIIMNAELMPLPA